MIRDKRRHEAPEDRRDGEIRRIQEEKQRELELVELDALAEETVLAKGRKGFGWGDF